MPIEKALFGPMSYRLLKTALDASSMRQKVIADNIANSETPGFRPNEVKFEELLAEVTTGTLKSALVRNDPRHLPMEKDTPIPAPLVVPSSPPDPNTGAAPGDFDVERAMADLNENKVRYHALVTLISGRLMGLKTAIESQ
jgi:flagellar basal-body rod protein FlgB